MLTLLLMQWSERLEVTNLEVNKLLQTPLALLVNTPASPSSKHESEINSAKQLVIVISSQIMDVQWTVMTSKS